MATPLKDIIQSQKQQGLEPTPAMKQLAEQEAKIPKQTKPSDNKSSQILAELKKLSKNIIGALNQFKPIIDQNRQIIQQQGDVIKTLTSDFNTQRQNINAPSFDPNVVKSPLIRTTNNLIGTEEQQKENIKLITDQTEILNKIEENTRGLKDLVVKSKSAEGAGAGTAAATTASTDTTSSLGDAAKAAGAAAAGAAAAKVLGRKGADTPETKPERKGGFLKGAAKFLRGVPLVGGIATAGIGAYEAYQQASDIEQKQKAGQITPEEAQTMKQSVVGGAVGGVGGAMLGAAGGAAIGSVVPVVGTALGGIIGGIAGYTGGSALGEKTSKFLSDIPGRIKGIREYFGGTVEEKPDEQGVQKTYSLNEAQFAFLSKDYGKFKEYREKVKQDLLTKLKESGKTELTESEMKEVDAASRKMAAEKFHKEIKASKVGEFKTTQFGKELTRKPDSLIPTKEEKAVKAEQTSTLDKIKPIDYVPKEIQDWSSEKIKTEEKERIKKSQPKLIEFDEAKLATKDPELYVEFDKFRKQRTIELAQELAVSLNRDKPTIEDGAIVAQKARQEAIEKFSDRIRESGAGKFEKLPEPVKPEPQKVSALIRGVEKKSTEEMWDVPEYSFTKEPVTNSAQIKDTFSEIPTKNVTPADFYPKVSLANNFKSIEPKTSEIVSQKSNDLSTATIQPIINTPTVVNAPVTNNQQTQNFASRSPSRNTESSYRQYDASRFAF